MNLIIILTIRLLLLLVKIKLIRHQRNSFSFISNYQTNLKSKQLLEIFRPSKIKRAHNLSEFKQIWRETRFESFNLKLKSSKNN